MFLFLFFCFFKLILINENEGYTGDTLICLITCPFINTLSCDLCYIMHAFFQRLTVLICANQVFFTISKAEMYYSSQSVFKWYVITDPMELNELGSVMFSWNNEESSK